MPSQLAVALGALALFQFKHFLCDFALQNEYQLRAKRTYGHLGGALHSFLHALATVPIFILLRPSFGLVLAIVAAETFLHYHIDWLKERIMAERNWGVEDREYWRMFGIDQMLHQLTYVGIIAVTS
ncbi:MAG TPA: DUF3307 domain-containing protein [Bryobacteraceae bacterium]|nr:DUF3307 domain-containing protein [Bryobacteraceae bacterium]